MIILNQIKQNSFFFLACYLWDKYQIAYLDIQRDLQLQTFKEKTIRIMELKFFSLRFPPNDFYKTSSSKSGVVDRPQTRQNEPQIQIYWYLSKNFQHHLLIIDNLVLN